MDILFVTITGYRTMTIEGYGAAFVGSALLLTSVCLTDYHNLFREDATNLTKKNRHYLVVFKTSAFRFNTNPNVPPTVNIV